MNKEKLLARKAEAMKQKEQLMAQINVIHGVISECDFWLEQIAQEPEGTECQQ